MSTLEHPIVGPREGDPNIKALAALAFGSLAFLSVAAVALLIVLGSDALTDGLLLLLSFFGLSFGMVGAFLGSISWIDVRRGVSDRHLVPAQVGAILGGLAALAVVAAVIVMFVLLIQAFNEFNSFNQDALD